MRLPLQMGVGCLAVLWLAGCSADSKSSIAQAQTQASSADEPTGSYQAQLSQARAAHVAALRAPDGWLSVTGSGRLKPGQYRLGADTRNDIVLPAGPAELGRLTLQPDGQARFQVSGGAAVTLDGQPVQTALLRPEQAGQGGSRLQVGERQFYLVRTGALWGWRFRDPQAAKSVQFHGFEYFPVDQRWRVQAQWHPYDTPEQLTLLTSIGTPLTLTVPGEAEFVRDGHRYRLRPVIDPTTRQLFFLFTDRTSGKESYGGARYLYAGPPRDGHLLLDFNLAENPPCAVSRHLVCPIAPPENRLDVPVRAGEKTYVALAH
ncbi:DUF1684 domain-containing protein [Xanthomonas maliensis]|uniref:DUF1684 domain-containing protein n=1 Tax=Xanthomonas maliensis TaxID=1321368 RepID=UPI0004CE5EF2|nr:DUF1684 domain-containing protein [Xanthomonas maliensis]KAB7765269.1 DUF1684 domain-containing protein [Xanthomonas maliensis]